MSCPKQSIELRRDILNTIEKNPTLPSHKFRVSNSHEHTRRIIKKIEELGLITREPYGQSYKSNLTDKGRQYQKALNNFTKFLDIF